MSPVSQNPRNDPCQAGFGHSATPVFRASLPQDLPAIRTIFREANLSLLEPAESQTANPVIGATLIHLLALNDEVLAALQWRYLGNEAEILDVAVPEKQRRQGYAYRLLSEFLLFASQHSVQDLFLEVRESNAAALALYSKLGFAHSGRRPNYYRQPGEAALLLHLKLTT